MPYTRESGYLQNMVEDGITFQDHDRDAVEKLRVSNPQSLIDTDFEYSLQNSKWEFLTLCNNYPGVYARSNEPAFTSEQIVSILPSGPGNKSVTVTVGTLPRAPFKIGDSVVLKETANTTYVDGAYIITAVLSLYSFQVVTKSPAALVGDQKTVYTALYTGGFYTNADISIVGVSALSGTKDALIQFSNPHNLYIKTPITVVDYGLSAVPWSGSFEVKKVLDDYRVTYETLTGSNYSSTTRVIPASGGVYARTEGVAVHRFFDGGVQINPGTSAPNARIMRQTRKYFKYQSGKSIQFSTGVLFRPVYEVTDAYIDKTLYNANSATYPYYDFVVSTEQYHGFAKPETYKQGVTIKTRGFELSAANDTNPYNKTFVVNKVLNSKTFSVQIPVNAQFNPFPTTDLSPGGISYVEVQGWNDATVRTGLFEDQNGMFFEFDGKDFWAVRRFTTTPINGTVSVQTKSPWLVGTNTKFISQLNVNDFVNVQGMSYQVGSIVSDLSATVTPTYRGPGASGLKVVLTKETRVHQSEFNLDKLDGTGPSGYTLDLNRMQMMFIDYSWYGAGKIRYGIRADKGKIIYFHEIYNNNVNIKAHMRSGNLPGRFEISSSSKIGKILQGIIGATGNIVVAGLSDNQYNGVYSLSGEQNGRPKYVKGGYFISWGGVSWGLIDGGNSAESDSNVAYPWLAEWTINAGIDPTGMVVTQAGNTTVVSKEDAEILPPKGQIVINNEYIKYTKGIDLPDNKIQLILNERNAGGLTAGPKTHPANSTFVSYNQNCSPALSHWGVAALMDGFFNEDKSYLFTATNSTSMTATSADQALISFRLSPSVDYGINGRLGERNLVNHSLLKPQQVGILTNNPLQVNVRVNCEPQTVFRNLSAWKFVANGSIAQYFDHTEGGSFEVQGTGGDLIASFVVTPEAKIGDGLFTSQSFDIGIVRELTNSILGGDFPFPDGPDVVTVSVKTLSHLDGNYTAVCQGKISWTEDQG